MNLLRKFKIENAGRPFLAWKDGLYYQRETTMAQFKHVLRRKRAEGRQTTAPISELVQITALFQISEDRLYVRAPAVWRHWQKVRL